MYKCPSCKKKGIKITDKIASTSDEFIICDICGAKFKNENFGSGRVIILTVISILAAALLFVPMTAAAFVYGQIVLVFYLLTVITICLLVYGFMKKSLKLQESFD